MLGEVKEGGRKQREKSTKTDRQRQRIGAGKSCSPDLVLRTPEDRVEQPQGASRCHSESQVGPTELLHCPGLSGLV